MLSYQQNLLRILKLILIKMHYLIFELFKLKGNNELVKVKVIENYKNLYIESEFNNKATFSIKIEHLDFYLISYFYEKYINIS